MTALFEGVGIALVSLRAHKMRAALTILGVAIGVTVVMVIGALISGFNKGVTDMLASLGPKTFWVGRYWGGQNDEDPEDRDPRAERRLAEDRRRADRAGPLVHASRGCLQRPRRGDQQQAGRKPVRAARPDESSHQDRRAAVRSGRHLQSPAPD